MHLAKLTLLFSVLFAVRTAQGIFWNKQFAGVANLGLQAAHSLIPRKPLDDQAGSLTRRNLSGNPESRPKGNLLEYGYFKPHNGEWASKTTHETKESGPKGEIIHRDDHIVVKWAGECDENMDIPQGFLGGLNADDEISPLHRMIHSHDHGYDDLKHDVQEVTTKATNKSLAEESVDIRHDDSTENTTTFHQHEPRLAIPDETNVNDTIEPPETESTASVSSDNHTETTNNADLEEVSLDVLDDQITPSENYISTTSESSVEAETVSINPQTNTNISMDRSDKTSVEESADTEKTIAVTFRSSTQNRSSAPPVQLRRIPSKDSKDSRKSLWMILRSKYRPNVTSNKNPPRPNVTGFTMNRLSVATPKESTQQNYFRTEMGSYPSASNYAARVESQLFDARPFEYLVPYSAQNLNGFAGSKPFSPQQREGYTRYGYGINSGPPRLELPNSQDWSSNYIAKPQPVLYGYDQNFPSFNSKTNPSADDASFLASIYRYMQSPYADEFALKQNLLVPNTPNRPAAPPTFDTLSSGNRWLWRT